MFPFCISLYVHVMWQCLHDCVRQYNTKQYLEYPMPMYIIVYTYTSLRIQEYMYILLTFTLQSGYSGCVSIYGKHHSPWSVHESFIN